MSRLPSDSWPSRYAGMVGLALILAVYSSMTLGDPGSRVKHVILMIADGAGYNSWDAASMYQGRWDASAGRSTQLYDGPGWVKLGCSTYPLNLSSAPTGKGSQDPNLVYDPVKAWDREQAYGWLIATPTDSAAAATALSMGTKTYNRAINWSDQDQPLQPTLAEVAKAAGKAVGVVTTVPWSHATPAGLSNAHNVHRDHYVEIASEMLAIGVMDVIMGCGNPDYDNNGAPIETAKEYKYVGGPETWSAIEAARARPDGTYQGFRPLSTQAEFTALTTGPTPPRVLGTAQVATTLQQGRQAADVGNPAADTPRNAQVPDLVTLVQGALNVLDEDPEGFLLAIEGGAIDWASHNQDANRLIQEQVDFIAAIEAIVHWIETHSHWGESLLIITSDHETGLLWGPGSDKLPFTPLVDQGPGRLPQLAFNAKGHTNSLVRVHARGAGSAGLAQWVVGNDPVRGAYIDNTGVANVLRYAVAGPAPALPASATPEP